MPIRVLSEATSHVLTSTQTLNNAVSAIKELVDNALDARASSISIEIAANTLDKIIVKDDGSGIGVEDRQLLCKRGYTSKIANLDDLAQLGGTFLGFRGTALASLAELSREVTIVTRVEGEQPATTLTFSSSGKLLSSSSASHNTGTTVRIEDFLASIPVRRQVVLKNPFKILEEIKRLLQSYALARPTVKISLRVLKVKDHKSNWSFAACKGHDVLSPAAAQVVGKSVVGSCELRSCISSEGRNDNLKMEALVLNPGGHDFPKHGNVGQYFSIDGRPINHDKDIAKDIAKLYKTYLQHASGSDATIPSKPFLVMHIHCPVSSYDVNVEPAKDVVLFHEPQQVLGLVEQLFIAKYSESNRGEARAQKHSISAAQSTDSSSFDIMLARRKPVTDPTDSSTVRPPTEGHTPVDSTFTTSTDQTALSLVEHFAEAMKHPSAPLNETVPDLHTASLNSPHGPKQFSTMGGFDVDNELEDFQLHRSSDNVEEEENYDPTDITINNPFTRAKAYSVRRPENLQINRDRIKLVVDGAEHSIRSQDLSSPVAGNLAPLARVSLNQIYRPPTPRTSPLPYQNPGPPYPRRNNKHSTADEGDSELDEDLNPPELRTPSNERQRSLMMNWVRTPTPTGSLSQKASSNNRSNLQPTTTPHPNLNSADPQVQSRIVNKPFRSPLKTPRSTDYGHTLRSKDVDPIARPSESSEPFMLPANEQDDDADLQHILEFEQRKKSLNQQLKHSQATLKPTDLARIQHGSLVAANFASSLSPQSSVRSAEKRPISQSITSTAEVAADAGRVALAPRDTVRRDADPHRNRYLAAARSLDTPKVLDHTGNQLTTGESTAPPFSNDQVPHTTPPLAPSDPRAYLISTRQFGLPAAIHASNHELKPKRAKSSRLPFETIPVNVKKHDILTVPATPFPGTASLSMSVHALSQVDEYLKKGVIEPVGWSQAGKDVERWQGDLEMLVKKWYRARIYRGSTGQEGEYEEVAVPDEVVSLNMALKAQLDSS